MPSASSILCLMRRSLGRASMTRSHCFALAHSGYIVSAVCLLIHTKQENTMDLKIFDRMESEVRGYIRSFPVVFNRSEEHTSELQSLMRSSYAAFCLNNT